jgi:hypothetical protein
MRTPGGFWEVRELGAGERLQIRNAIQGVELNNLNDDDLEQIRWLVDEMLGMRKTSMPGKKEDEP